MRTDHAWLESPDHVEQQMSALAKPPNPMPPLLRAKIAMEYIGTGKTKFYELIRMEILDMVKDGRRTYITRASCDRYLLSLRARGLRHKTIRAHKR
jgi:hypothetical protein